MKKLTLTQAMDVIIQKNVFTIIDTQIFNETGDTAPAKEGLLCDGISADTLDTLVRWGLVEDLPDGFNGDDEDEYRWYALTPLAFDLFQHKIDAFSKEYLEVVHIHTDSDIVYA